MRKPSSGPAVAPDPTSDDPHSPVTAYQGNSRQQFKIYRGQVLRRELPNGSFHGSADSRDPKDRVRTSSRLVWQFFQLLRPFRSPIIVILISLTIATLLGLIPPAATKFVVDYGLTGHPLPSHILNRVPDLADPKVLLFATVMAVAVMVTVRSAIHLWGRWYATVIAKRIQLSVRRKVFEHAVRLPLHRIYEIRSGGVASILREDGGSVGELVFGMIFNPWRALIQLIGSLAILGWVDWRLLSGALVFIPAVFFTHQAWINRIRPQYRAIRKVRERIDAGATETFAGMRIVRAFSRQQRESNRFMRDNHLMARQEFYAWWWMRVVEIFWETLIPIASAVLLFYGGWQVLEARLTVGDLMMFLVYLAMLLEPLGTLAQSATAFQNSLSGLDRVLDLLAEPREMPITPDLLKVNRDTVVGRISFQHVSFAYPGAEHPALEDVSLEVAAGQTVALVGPSGAGKTTLSNLVARFYDPTAGQVLLDGIDLRKYDVESFRSLLGVVEQDVFLFDGTIAENIAYARRDATQEDISRAAAAANATEFIARMPQGLQTVIGERGVKLSGGQRQRLALARAILADPKLLILDEATSNLDTEAEQLIQQSLSKLMQGRTCFVIAHRLSTIAAADLIVVIENGRISQTGTHSQLMALDGRYRTMVEQQVQMALGKAQTVSS